MKPRFHLRPRDHLRRSTAKQALNRALFCEIAPKYEFITKALSLGRDASWKRWLIAELPELPAPICVDLACGTGDLTRLLAARFPGGRIIGIDLTPAMLEIARTHSPARNLQYVEGTIQALPFQETSVDLVTGGYALRNAPDLDRALYEINRILRPRGVAAFLDFSKPRSRMGRAASHAILKVWGGAWGWVLHGNPDVYGYIADSLRLYPDRGELRTRFFERNFVMRTRRSFYGGLLEAFAFQKRENSLRASASSKSARPRGLR